MPLTLAVDTTGEYGSIALADETGTREEALLHEPQGFSHVLFAEIEALLRRQSAALREIALFAAASGPGSFTGVRVGLSAMKGLGEVLCRPVAAVSNLEAVASFGTAPLRAAVIRRTPRGVLYRAVLRGRERGGAGTGSAIRIVPEAFARTAFRVGFRGPRRVCAFPPRNAIRAFSQSDGATCAGRVDRTNRDATA